MKAQGEGFAEDLKLIRWREGCDHLSDGLEEGSIVREGVIMDNLTDVVEGPFHSL